MNELETKLKADEIAGKTWIAANKKPLTIGFAAGILLMLIVFGIAHIL